MGIRRLVKLTPLLFIITVFGWRTEISIDAGRPHNLYIGMAAGATDGFDKEFDKVSPPPPPVGFFCYFPVEDSVFDFIDALWGDIRAFESKARWEINLKRVTQPTQVVFSGLPEIGLLSIDGIPVIAESLAMSFGKTDSVLVIDYSRGFYEEPSATINFELPAAAEVVIVIRTDNGEPVRRLPDMYLAGGEHSLGWNAKDNHGEPVPPGVYYAHIRAKWEQEITELEVETVVKNNVTE
ncbi:hypothetical protein DRQ36_00225 [bacterium]|nr:MAG: hypothetical protein DRQ36_00225 [bacterium]